MGNKRNNNRKNNRHSDTLAVKLYNLIIDNDEIREVCNKFIDIDDLFDFAEENWCDEGDTDVDVIKDIMEDNTMLRGFSVRKFLPVIEAWLNDNFNYHDGEFYPIIEDIISLTSNANQSTLVAYEEVTRICSNIMNDYDMEFTTEVGVLGIIHAVKACINHIKTVGDKERGDSYTAASSSTKESEKEEEEVKEEVVEESEKPETKEDTSKESKESEDNASKVDAEELKDKVDVESIAQNIYSEVKGSGKLEELIMNSIIEGVRQVVDAGKMSDDTEKKISEGLNNESKNCEPEMFGDVIKDIVGQIIPAIVGDNKYEGVIDRLRNKKPIIDVEESELREVPKVEIVPVEVVKEEPNSEHKVEPKVELNIDKSATVSNHGVCGIQTNKKDTVEKISDSIVNFILRKTM